jgi:hypothetical protein
MVGLFMMRTLCMVGAFGALAAGSQVSAQIPAQTPAQTRPPAAAGVAVPGDEMRFADDPKTWATPRTLVAPAFPSSELSLAGRAYVDVEVSTDVLGAVKEARIIKSEPAKPAFENAVSDVAKQWLFTPNISGQCVPQETSARVRVWFEARGKEGVATIAPTVVDGAEASAAGAGSTKRAAWSNRIEVRDGAKDHRALKDVTTQAALYVVSRVDAKTGEVKDTRVSWFQSIPADTGREQFSEAVASAMQRARFDTAEGTTYAVCAPFRFNMP